LRAAIIDDACRLSDECVSEQLRAFIKGFHAFATHDTGG